MKLLLENWRGYLNEAEESNIIYHGVNTTGAFNWDYNYVGLALDRYGPGFYLTSSIKEAAKYATDKGQVIKVNNRLSNPLKISLSGTAYNPGGGVPQELRDLLKDDQELAAILPEETDDSKKAEFIKNVRESRVYGGELLKYLFRNVYKAEKNPGRAKEFFNKLMKVTGHDGILLNFSNETWVISWDPSKLKILGSASSEQIKAKMEGAKNPEAIQQLAAKEGMSNEKFRQLQKMAVGGDQEARQALINWQKKVRALGAKQTSQAADTVDWSGEGAK
jgi:hypothetical protein